MAMNPNAKFINGDWYEEEYSEKWYRKTYIDEPEPQWAKDCNQYGVDFMAMVYGLPREAKILDCGSGVGRIMQAWKRRGFYNVHGIEISGFAVRAANEPNMIQGTVADMSRYRDKQFDLVSSFALLEHIDESIEDQVIKEMLRVGKRQAHFMALDKGTDPSHINMKTAMEWGKVFARHVTGEINIIVLRGPLMEEPLLLVFHGDEGTHPLNNTVVQMRDGSA